MSSVLTLLALLFASGASSVPAPPEADAALTDLTDLTETAVWAASGVIAADGALRLVPGWSVRIGLGGRAHLVGPSPRASRAIGPWDDEALARGVRVAVRVTARDAGAIYVSGQLRQDHRTRPFLLRWDAASGAWSEVT